VFFVDLVAGGMFVFCLSVLCSEIPNSSFFIFEKGVQIFGVLFSGGSGLVLTWIFLKELRRRITTIFCGKVKEVK